jgi:hypothetical protein
VAAALKAVLEVLAGGGPIFQFLLGFGSSNMWPLIEGLQIPVHYPMLHVESPANLGILQAALRKMATFEMVDGDTVNDLLWEYEKEEEVMFELQNTGYDSNQFQASFGFPLYVLAYFIVLTIVLAPINCLRSKCK